MGSLIFTILVCLAVLPENLVAYDCYECDSYSNWRCTEGYEYEEELSTTYCANGCLTTFLINGQNGYLERTLRGCKREGQEDAHTDTMVNLTCTMDKCNIKVWEDMVGSKADGGGAPEAEKEEGNKCWSCSSEHQESCNDPNQYGEYHVKTQYCQNGCMLSMRRKEYNENMAVWRGCRLPWQNDHYTEWISNITCFSDLCNAAPNMGVSGSISSYNTPPVPGHHQFSCYSCSSMSEPSCSSGTQHTEQCHYGCAIDKFTQMGMTYVSRGCKYHHKSHNYECYESYCNYLNAEHVSGAGMATGTYLFMATALVVCMMN